MRRPTMKIPQFLHLLQPLVVIRVKSYRLYRELMRITLNLRLEAQTEFKMRRSQRGERGFLERGQL